MCSTTCSAKGSALGDLVSTRAQARRRNGPFRAQRQRISSHGRADIPSPHVPSVPPSVAPAAPHASTKGRRVDEARREERAWPVSTSVAGQHERDRMTAAIHDEARRWETLLAETREARIGKPIGGASTFQDLVAHLTAWRTDAVDRLEATVAGTREPRASSNTSRTSGHGSIGGTAWEGEGQCAETVGCDMATLDPRARSQPAGGSGSRSRGLRMAPDYLITCRSRQRDSGPARSHDVPSSASSSIDR